MESTIICKRKVINKELLIIYLVSLIFILGCTNNNLNYDRQVKISHKFMKEFGEVKDPTQYEKLIKKEIEYFQEPFFSDQKIKNLRASILKLAYSRLFIIEDIQGNKYLADIYFKKAQYWTIISMECFSMLTTKELSEKSRITKEELRKNISKLNPIFYKNLQKLKHKN